MYFKVCLGFRVITLFFVTHFIWFPIIKKLYFCCNHHNCIMNGILKNIFQFISKLLASKNFYVSKSLQYSTSFKQELDHNLDFVRYTTLELCCNEIKLRKVEGNAAELGVYKGEFAKRVNQLLPDKKLYLFDTFEGFDSRDVAKETEHNFSNGKQDFSNTNTDLVMGKMRYPDNCIIKKGFFPDTAQNLEDRFCFVSIDADLYEPILNGLIYFYPRLNKNGYIFIHDFNNDFYKGSRQAVMQYCNENGINYVPVPDNAGTVIITK